MDILEFALKMEKYGENYYREILQQTENKGLRSILTLLADAEVKHQRTIEQMIGASDEVKMEEDRLFNDVKNVFEEMKRSGSVFEFDQSQPAVYMKAKEIEEKSYTFYKQSADEAASESNRTLLLRLAEEENKHMILMDNLVEFVTRPQNWLEDAEWTHLDEY